MREHENRSPNRNRQRPNPFSNRFIRNRLSASDWERESNSADHIYSYGRRARIDQFNLTIAWYHYRIAIVFASAATFGIGFAQCIAKVTGVG